MSFEHCWLRICQNEREHFQTKSGLDFTYSILKNSLITNRTDQNIPKSQIKKVFEMGLVGGPGKISNEIRGSSYIWAILNDSRIKYFPKKSQIKIGMQVEIVTKENQGTEKLTIGTVKNFLTSSETHPHGIKVMLENGEIGRVKTLSKTNKNKKSTTTSNYEFIDLETKEIPKTEDQIHEFKEFYHYQLQIENYLTGSNKDLEIVKNLQKSAIKFVATAISAFGNSNGGFLFLGINSSGIICGLEKDLKFGGFTDYSDSFANNMRDQFANFIKDKIFLDRKMKIHFRKINDKTICLIQILPSNKPLYLSTSKGKLFYIRSSTPRAESLDVEEQYRYIKDRFPNFE